jgi:hypothetical protein
MCPLSPGLSMPFLNEGSKDGVVSLKVEIVLRSSIGPLLVPFSPDESTKGIDVAGVPIQIEY